VALSGPTHAEEVARDMPTLIVAGSPDEAAARKVQQIFTTPTFRVYTNTDRRGVELGGAVKNVIALAVGIAMGLDYGDNAKAALITRGNAELARLGVAMGCKAETFAGLSGMGDLIVTCTS
ncbi:MAG TPA: glycerol-3-phosphate dehydrogenase, partial [Ruminococcaceae bacterium]|nr:glycerol-3-phosphate dehydrogenase [Oscillospiraceae bacterium]